MEGNFLDSFWVLLGFKSDTEGIEKFQRELEGLRNSALALGGILAGAAAGVGLFVEHVAKSLGDMQHFAEVNHITTAELQAFNAIARDNYIDVDAMDQGIAELNKRLGQAQLGTGRLLPILKKLGIGLKDTHGHARNVNSILGAVADKMKKLTPAENLGLGARLGLDPGMILLLQKGGDNWRKVFGEAQKNVAFTPEELQLGKETAKTFEHAGHALDVMGDLIALKVMPAVDKLLDRFLEWYKAASADPNSILNRSLDLLGQFADIAADQVGDLYDAVSVFASFISDYVLPDWITDQLPKLAYLIVPALIAGFAMLAVWAVGSLITAGAAVAAFCADAIAWFTAFSIAELIALFPIEAIVIAIVALAIAAYEVYEYWQPLMMWFGDIWDWITEKVHIFTDALKGAWEKTKEFFGGDDTHISTILRESEAARGQSPSWARSGWGSQSFNRSNTVVQHVTGTQIHVHSPDPEKAGEKVKEALRDNTHRRLIRNSQGSHF